MSTHNLLSRNMKKISFLSENFQFLEEKFSVCLNRHVFIMLYTTQPKLKGVSSCSKLTTSLVNDSLKFISSDTQIC